LFKLSAEQGNTSAQSRLGFVYALGLGVEKNNTKADFWLRKAAEKGHPVAQFYIGLFHLDERLEKNSTEAFKWTKKSAEAGCAPAQTLLGAFYSSGTGVSVDQVKAVEWYRKASEQEEPNGESFLGRALFGGDGVEQDFKEAVKWFKRSADKGNHYGQYGLGKCYLEGKGVVKNPEAAVVWLLKSADQGDADAQTLLGFCYLEYGGELGGGVEESYRWFLLASAQGHSGAIDEVSKLEDSATAEQLKEGRRLAQQWEAAHNEKANRAEFNPHEPSETIEKKKVKSRISIGTGFVINSTGFIVTNNHVIRGWERIRILTQQKEALPAKVVLVDEASDLVLLKVDRDFDAIPIHDSKLVRLGASVATIGFPNIVLQGVEPKLTRGDISALTGLQDNEMYFQISVPTQPGNSGGALIDERGNVVGVVTAQLDNDLTLKNTGAAPQNVNYAIKSSYLLALIGKNPAVSKGLLPPNGKDIAFEDAVEKLKKASVIVFCDDGKDD
jgi:TPR repeat protein